MKHVLIITQDVVKIQLYSGFIGKSFAWVYLGWLTFRIQAAIIYHRFVRGLQVTVLASECFRPRGARVYYFGQELAKINFASNRKLYWQVTNKILRAVRRLDLTGLFATRLNTYLAYHYLIYFDLYQQLFKQLKPDQILILGESPKESIAKLVAEGLQLPVRANYFLSLGKLHLWLVKYLLSREYRRRLKLFLRLSHRPKPPLTKMRQAVLLSLDFFRHLRTLTPIYNYLLTKQKNPWLVCDFSKPEDAFNNLKLDKPQFCYLASFLPQRPSRRQIIQELHRYRQIYQQVGCHLTGRSLAAELARLTLPVAEPIITYSLILSRLYLQSALALLKTTCASRVVVVSDVRFPELSLAAAAKKQSIASLLVSPNTLLDLAEINPYNSTDQVAVVGRFIKSKLIHQGVAAKKIHLVGDPQVENYYQLQSQLSSDKVLLSLNLPKDKKIILLISFRANWVVPQSEKQAFFQMVYQSVQAIPGAVLVVKPHPTESRQRLRLELKQWGMANVLVSNNRRLELIDLINAAFVIVQSWSMTIFEAAMMNKPVVIVNPFKKDYNLFLPLIGKGGGVEVTSLAQLNRWLRRLINPNNPMTVRQLVQTQKACEYFIKTPDGRVTQRIYRLLW